MRTMNDESVLIEHFNMLETTEICLVGNEESCAKIVESIKNIESWVDTSGKDMPPPDFYNDSENLMMEVMRVDDHGFIDNRGKKINPTLQKEKESIKKVKEVLGDKLDNITLVVANAPTDLPTDEDHSFDKYKKSFERIVNKHKKSVDLYRKNHTNHKLIFFVYDESSAYLLSRKPRKAVQSIIVEAMPHFIPRDKNFMEVIKNCGADYVIVFMPYKRVQAFSMMPDLPQAYVFEVNNLPGIIEQCYLDYNDDYMISSEK